MTFLTRSLTEAGHRMENKHYFSVFYLTFDFEGKDLKTLLGLTGHDWPAVNYLKVVVIWKAHELLCFGVSVCVSVICNVQIAFKII